MDFHLLKSLCKISSPSGEELTMKLFLLEYIHAHSHTWAVKPEIIEGESLQDCLILKFGNPSISVFAHMDTVGFHSRYENQLIPIGSPDVKEGCLITGEDSQGPIECSVFFDEKNRLYHNFPRKIDRGTSLVFKNNYSETKNRILTPYLDNRIGIWICLKLAEKLTNGILVFSCWEEHGGGSVPYLCRYIWEKYAINKALIADVTWSTDGILPGRGTVISLRDRFIPRKSFISQIIHIAEKKGIEHQLEVEGEGSSDGGEIQRSSYPINWCFIGPSVENTHSPLENVYKKDIISTLKLFEAIIQSP